MKLVKLNFALTLLTSEDEASAQTACQELPFLLLLL